MVVSKSLCSSSRLFNLLPFYFSRDCLILLNNVCSRTSNFLSFNKRILLSIFSLEIIFVSERGVLLFSLSFKRLSKFIQFNFVISLSFKTLLLISGVTFLVFSESFSELIFERFLLYLPDFLFLRLFTILFYLLNISFIPLNLLAPYSTLFKSISFIFVFRVPISSRFT